MTKRFSKGLVIAEAVLLLLPATLLVVFVLFVSYPAYPIPNLRPITLAFDAAMLVTVLGLAAAWRLAWLYLRAGPVALRSAHPAWRVLLALGAILGLLGAAIAIGHMMTPRTAGDHVGFALLAPAAPLAIVAIHLLVIRQRTGLR